VNRVGRYEITELLGQGGMGTVYRAFDPLLTRVVAVKVISTQLSTQPELRERFFREARAAAQLDHPNIITVYDLGEQDGTPYLAMQFLEGQDLEQRMRAPEGMTLGAKLEVALAIATGLAHAHASGVVHRDVKPANVFITTDGQVKILDFGLARLVTSELTRSNMMVGTVNYMAPEQLRSEKTDHRADIFSLGVVLYELVGGRKPFQAESFASTMYKILEETPDPLEHLVPDLPPRLIAVVDRAMAKSPDDRYQFMADLVRDLDEAYAPLRGAPGLAGSQLGSALRLALGARPKSNPSLLPADSDAPTVVGPPPTEAVRSLPASPSPSVGQPPEPGSPQPAARPGVSWRPIAAAGAALAVVLLLFVVLRKPASPPAAPADAPHPTEGGAANAATGGRAASEAAAAPAQSAPSPGAAPATAAVGPAAASPPPPVSPGVEASGGSVDRARLDRAATGLAAARAAAVAAGAPSSVKELFTAADRQVAAARDARARGRLADASARMEAATALFQTAGETARQQAAARAAREQAEQARQVAPPPAARQDVSPPQPPVVSPPAPTQPAPAPTQPPAIARPPAPAPAPSPPAVEPLDVPSETRVARDAAIALLARYTTALEHRDIDALKAIWPGLGGREQAALEAEFANATAIEASFDTPKIDVTGTRTTITGLRHYALRTRDGQSLRSETLTTLALKKSGDEWVIESVRHRAVR
jgi:eukaryotic-like serine/threonine-protein kinase